MDRGEAETKRDSDHIFPFEEVNNFLTEECGINHGISKEALERLLDFIEKRNYENPAKYPDWFTEEQKKGRHFLSATLIILLYKKLLENSEDTSVARSFVHKSALLLDWSGERTSLLGSERTTSTSEGGIVSIILCDYFKDLFPKLLAQTNENFSGNISEYVRLHSKSERQELDTKLLKLLREDRGQYTFILPGRYFSAKFLNTTSKFLGGQNVIPSDKKLGGLAKLSQRVVLMPEGVPNNAWYHENLHVTNPGLLMGGIGNGINEGMTDHLTMNRKMGFFEELVEHLTDDIFFLGGSGSQYVHEMDLVYEIQNKSEEIYQLLERIYKNGSQDEVKQFIEAFLAKYPGDYLVNIFFANPVFANSFRKSSLIPTREVVNSLKQYHREHGRKRKSFFSGLLRM